MSFIPELIRKRFIPDETNVIFKVFQQNYPTKPTMGDVGHANEMLSCNF